MGEHVRAMLAYAHAGVPTVDYGNNIRQMALEEGVKDAFDFPGFVPAYIRPLFCRGVGPFRWAALSGDPEDIFRTDAKVKELMPDSPALHNWLDMARARIKFQGLPARICWVGLGDRHRLGLAFNEMVASGELKAPIVIGRDHLDSGSVASPNRETEAMQDGSDAISDWPLLNALLNCASGATWVSIHHGGGVGMGFSQHAGMVIVADGTPEAARRIERVLWNDPASGVMRHADAGYETAIACAKEKGLDLPSLSATLVRLHARCEFDRLSMGRAQIGALPLVLALVEFRGSYAAVFREQPLKRGEHGAIVCFAVVGLGVERLDLGPERLGPTRGRDRAAFDEKIGERQRFRVPRLAKHRLAVLGLEKAKLRPVQDSSPRDRRTRDRGSPSLPAKGRRRRSSRYRDARRDARRAPQRRRKHGRRDGHGSPLPCPAHIEANAYGRARRRAGNARPRLIAKRGGVLTLTAKLRGRFTMARAASAVCGGRPGFAAKAGAPRLISSSDR